jgi:hypothetical protein
MNTLIGLSLLGGIIIFLGLSIRAIKSISKDSHNHHPQAH